MAGKSFWKLPSCYQLIFGWDCFLKKEVLIRHVFTIKVERVPFHVATVAQWIRHRPPKMQSEQQLLRWQPGIAGSSPASGCFHGKACADTFFLRRKTNKGSAACENVLCDRCGVDGVTVSMVPSSRPGFDSRPKHIVFFSDTCRAFVVLGGSGYYDGVLHSCTNFILIFDWIYFVTSTMLTVVPRCIPYSRIGLHIYMVHEAIKVNSTQLTLSWRPQRRKRFWSDYMAPWA